MLTIEKIIPFDLSLIKKITQEPSNLLLIDIETTGFSPKQSQIYLLGFICIQDQYLKLTQWLCEKKEDEYELLYRLSKLLHASHTILHYNGSSFDIPFIKKRLNMYGILSAIDAIKQIDLYLELKPLQPYLNLENLKLKTVEQAFGFHRRDKNSGRTLINIFSHYTKNPSIDLQELLLLHNEDDLLGLYHTLKANDKILFFKSAASESFLIEELLVDVEEKLLKIRVPHKANFEATIIIAPYTLEISLEEVCISIPINSDTLYYFFPNYKDYYYLPLEDMAIHRSIGQFVDKAHREKATKHNCYIKKRGTFIPLLKNYNITLNTYKYTVNDSMCYVEITEDLLMDHQLLSNLFSQILLSL